MIDYKWIRLMKLVRIFGTVIILVALVIFSGMENGRTLVIIFCAVMLAAMLFAGAEISRRTRCPHCGASGAIPSGVFMIKRGDKLTCAKCGKEIEIS